MTYGKRDVKHFSSKNTSSPQFLKLPNSPGATDIFFIFFMTFSACFLDFFKISLGVSFKRKGEVSSKSSLISLILASFDAVSSLSIWFSFKNSSKVTSSSSSSKSDASSTFIFLQPHTLLSCQLTYLQYLVHQHLHDIYS